MKFVLLHVSVFTLKESIFPKLCSNSRLKSAKSPLPVDLRLSKTSLLKVLLKIITENEGNFQHHFVCLFFAQRSYRNCARVSHAMAQFFSMEPTPLLEKVRRYPVAFSYPYYNKRNGNWYTYTKP